MASPMLKVVKTVLPSGKPHVSCCPQSPVKKHITAAEQGGCLLPAERGLSPRRSSSQSRPCGILTSARRVRARNPRNGDLRESTFPA